MNGGDREPATGNRGDWSAWAGGVREAQRFVAPVEIPGWSERPWVVVRALTEAEALEQESLGLIEEYEVVQRGLGEPEVRVRRVYDLVAMAEYEWERCLVDWCLPDGFLTPRPSLSCGGTAAGEGAHGNGSLTPGSSPSEDRGPAASGRGGNGGGFTARRRATNDPEGNLEFLRGMGPCLGAWVRWVLDQVNWRLPEQRAQIEAAKKN